MFINSIRAAALALVIGAIALPQFAAADDIENFVVQKAYNAAMSGDSETAMSMVTEDVFFTVLPPPGHPMWSQGPYLSGKEALGNWWALIASGEGQLQIVELAVDGDRAMFKFEFSMARLKAMGIDPAMSDGVAILRDGKIYGMMMSFTPETQEAIADAQN